MRAFAGMALGTMAISSAAVPQTPLAATAKSRSKDELDLVIFERQQTMSQLAKDAELLGQIVAGIAPADKLAEATAAITKGAREASEQFQDPVPGGHTRAEAWTNNADFLQRFDSFARNADAMAKAGKSGDVGAVTSLLIEALPCKQCHDLYRERKPGT